MVKNLPASAGERGDLGSIPGSGRSPGGGNGNLLQDSCVENSTDSGAWWAIVHSVTRVGHNLVSIHTLLKLIIQPPLDNNVMECLHIIGLSHRMK